MNYDEVDSLKNRFVRERGLMTDEIIGSWYADKEYFDRGEYINLKYVFNSDRTVTEYWYLSENGDLKQKFDLYWENDGSGEYTINDGYDFRKYSLSGSKLCDVYFDIYYHRI